MKETIEVTDIFKGAYFLCSGAELIAAKLIERNQVRFEFESEDIYNLEHEYNNGTALVNPQKLRAMLNILRDVVFKTLREPVSQRRRELAAN